MPRRGKRYWTAEKIALLTRALEPDGNHYPTLEEVAQSFPEVTPDAVYWIAHRRLGYVMHNKRLVRPSGRHETDWTHSEDVRLRSLIRKGTSHADIAKQLGRSTNAVRSRASILGYLTKPRKRLVKERDSKGAIRYRATCATCGTLIASQSTRCRSCMAKGDARKPRPDDWTQAEVDLLLKLFDEGLRWTAIRAALKNTRTLSALKTRVAKYRGGSILRP